MCFSETNFFIFLYLLNTVSVPVWDTKNQGSGREKKLGIFLFDLLLVPGSVPDANE